MGRSPRIGIKRRLALKARDNWCSAGQAMSGEAAPHDSLGRSPRIGIKNRLALKARDIVELIPDVPLVKSHPVTFEE
jgi:hypothetical protein